MEFSLLDLQGKEFKKVNRYLEQVLLDAKELDNEEFFKEETSKVEESNLFQLEKQSI